MKKKTSIKNILYWLKDAWLKAIVVFLIVVAGFSAYAAITWPGADPNPTTGVVGMFVDESDTAFTTGIDYDAANEYCANGSNAPGSHICNSAEMINSINHGGVNSPINTYSGSATLWINNGPPGFTANANDCLGWSKTTSPSTNPNYGRIWNFTSSYGGLLPCRTGKKFACCK